MGARDSSRRRLFGFQSQGFSCRGLLGASAYLWLVGNGGMGQNYNYYYYHSSIPYKPKVGQTWLGRRMCLGFRAQGNPCPQSFWASGGHVHSGNGLTTERAVPPLLCQSQSSTVIPKPEPTQVSAAASSPKLVASGLGALLPAPMAPLLSPIEDSRLRHRRCDG